MSVIFELGAAPDGTAAGVSFEFGSIDAADLEQAVAGERNRAQTALEAAIAGLRAQGHGAIQTSDLSQTLRAVFDSIPGSYQADGLTLRMIDQRGNTNEVNFTLSKAAVANALGGALTAATDGTNRFTLSGVDRDGAPTTIVIEKAAGGAGGLKPHGR